MQLDTTFRGLTKAEAKTAASALERGATRFDRLIEEPSTLRAVVEVGPEVRVTLSLHLRRAELTATDGGHDSIPATISNACEKLKSQIVRHRHRHEADRHRAEL